MTNKFYGVHLDTIVAISLEEFMGGSIAFLFFVIIVIVYGSLWVLSLSLFVSGRRKKSELMILAGAILSVILTGVGIKTVYDSVSIWKPDNVYKITFGSSPPSDVKNIESYYYYFGDSGVTYLKFKASPATIKKLTMKGWTRLKGQKLQELAKARASNSANQTADNSTPSWFKPNITASTVVYSAEHRMGDFASENEDLIYDSATRQAYYSFQGID